MHFYIGPPIIEPTLVNLVPHLVYRLCEKHSSDGGDGLGDFSSVGLAVRLLQVGGAALRGRRLATARISSCPPLQGYGLTETSPVICSNIAGRQRYDSVGPPVDGVEVRIDHDRVLWTRGPHVMLGYWRDEPATQQRLRDGWFCTGDLAEQLDDGSLRIIGRADDQITLSTGYKVAPLELTRRLSGDAWVEHLVLVGQNRPFIAALVYPRRECLPESMRDDQQALAQALIARWQPLLRDLPRSMQIERLAVMKSPPSVDNGGLNFKGALRRQFLEQTLYRAEVEKLYSQSNTP